MLNNAKTLKILKYLSVIIIGSLALFAIIYFSGFRLVSGFKFKKVGTVTVVTPLPETQIFLDKSKKLTNEKENTETKITLSPTRHNIIVSKDGYFPWQKDFNVISRENVTLRPVFVSQNPSGNIITVNDPEYYKIRNFFYNDTLPTKINPKISKDESTQIWVENNTIYSKSGDIVSEVIKPESEIKNLDFYKNRNDVLIFSSGYGIYAIDSDKTSGQNFLPIYKGQTPVFVTGEDTFIYIFDFGTLMQVVI